MVQFPEHERLARSANWRVRLLHQIARAIGVLVHIDALPYGSQRLLRSRGWPAASTSGGVSAAVRLGVKRSSALG